MQIPAQEAASSYACTCFKNCAHYTGKNELKKYRCTGGEAKKVLLRGGGGVMAGG